MPDAPANPVQVACFFQPARNIPAMLALGVNTFFGPEVENRSTLTPAAIAAKEFEWVQAVAAAGARCVLKNPTGPLPANCVGVLTQVDEPNGKGVPAAGIAPNVADLRARYPGVPVFVSLAGDKVTSANLRKPAELQALLDYLTLADVVTVDVYAMNRNASRYKPTWTADAVKTIKAVRPAVKCWPWIEANDQRLKPPAAPDVNREPTPDEIKATVDAALAAGADGIGWFLTCDSGAYGWGVKDPAYGDSYFPQVNRAGASMAPQYAMVRQIADALNLQPSPVDPAPVPDPAAQVAQLLRENADLAKQVSAAADQRGVDLAHIAELNDALKAVLAARDATDAAMAKAEAAAK